jgi:hypothetical protein
MASGGAYPPGGSGPPSLPPAAAPLPGWLGPVVTLTTQVGVPTVIAGVLLWFVLFRLDTTLHQIEEAEEARVKILAAMQDTTLAAFERLGDRFEQVVKDNIAANKDLADRYHGRGRDGGEAAR